jgi:anti-sigma B factor antagonist
MDLSKVDWMNSSGLGILISGLTTIKNAGGELRLAKVTDKIQSLLLITKLISVFSTHDSVEDALMSLPK